MTTTVLVLIAIFLVFLRMTLEDKNLKLLLLFGGMLTIVAAIGIEAIDAIGDTQLILLGVLTVIVSFLVFMIFYAAVTFIQSFAKGITTNG